MGKTIIIVKTKEDEKAFEISKDNILTAIDLNRTNEIAEQFCYKVTFEINNNDILKPLTIKYIKNIHPELTEKHAIELLQFAKEKTIEYELCYGKGEIIYPKFLEKTSNK